MEGLAGIRELGGATRAVEKPDVELPFELVEGLRYSGLAQIELGRSLCEPAVIDDGREQPEMVEIDGHYPESLIDENNVLAS